MTKLSVKICTENLVNKYGQGFVSRDIFERVTHIPKSTESTETFKEA